MSQTRRICVWIVLGRFLSEWIWPVHQYRNNSEGRTRFIAIVWGGRGNRPHWLCWGEFRSRLKASTRVQPQEPSLPQRLWTLSGFPDIVHSWLLQCTVLSERTAKGCSHDSYQLPWWGWGDKCLLRPRNSDRACFRFASYPQPVPWLWAIWFGSYQRFFECWVSLEKQKRQEFPKSIFCHQLASTKRDPSRSNFSRGTLLQGSSIENPQGILYFIGRQGHWRHRCFRVCQFHHLCNPRRMCSRGQWTCADSKGLWGL